jgi:IS1 family transposase
MFAMCISKKIYRILSRIARYRSKVTKKDNDSFTDFLQDGELAVRVFKTHSIEVRNANIRRIYINGHMNKSAIQASFGITYYQLNKILGQVKPSTSTKKKKKRISPASPLLS